MSGGVDSSLAAKLLVDEGHDVLGIFLSFWKDSGSLNIENKCCSAKALMDARSICTQLGIRLYVLDFVQEFKKEIVDNFLSEYSIGNTPNPCVRCNKFVKIGLLIKKAKDLGYNYVATGHYARIKQIEVFKDCRRDINYSLFKGVDQRKDQSYYLYKFNQKELSSLLFPLGSYKKEEVRVMAQNFKLSVAAKKESQEICFVPRDHNDFLKKYLVLKPGEIRTVDEEVVGRHQGLPLYTIGQRKGIEIGGVGPFYVVKKNEKNNVLYVTNDALDLNLFKNELVVKEVNWIDSKVRFLIACEAVIRYGSKGVKCIVKKQDSDCDQYLVKFDDEVRAVTSGQSIVFYNKNEVLGGGVIV